MNMFVPTCLKNSSKTPGLKGVYPFFLCLGELPSITSIYQQYGHDQAFEEGDTCIVISTYIRDLRDVVQPPEGCTDHRYSLPEACRDLANLVDIGVKVCGAVNFLCFSISHRQVVSTLLSLSTLCIS